ncbi:MAG: winged helix-turn-helix transcriptional regulator [Candidatus Lokiarchaeota archaeon]|nr:winged helix-turn-helix transcriptional regulator [Candidatus Lokiarchaeota archaeon]
MYEEGSNAEIKLTLEQVFSSRGRAKILELLAKKTELNISEIVKRTSLNHSSASRHLHSLSKLGFIQEKKYGRIKIYRYCSENINARALKNLIALWSES